MPDPASVLHQYYGYYEFRPLQKEIVTDILNKKDTFVLMPTGGGKSLCYQLPSIMMQGTTVVISPLISLMKDQVDALRELGVKAEYLNSTLLPSERQTILHELKTNKLKLIYLAPERLVQDEFIETLKSVNLNFFAIDEAHCISQWGHDFRPEYRQLRLLKKEFPNIPVTALTATATPRVRQDILNQLAIAPSQTYQASFNRPNLKYFIFPKQDTLEHITKYIKSHPKDAGIIYCQSRKRVESITASLQKLKINALPYHAGLSDEERKYNQEKFIKEDVDIIVATIAFGMGINKPNVRFVIHYDLPKTLEHYYQETGRAGRDGLESECILFFSFGDKYLYDNFINEMENDTERTIAKHQLQTVLDYAQSKQCRRKQLLNYFAEDFTEENCNACDNCLSPRQTFDGTTVTQQILSCIYRTNQLFASTHIIEILTGSKSKKIQQYSHDQLSTYNIVKDYSRKDLKFIIYELIQQGILRQTDDQFVSLKLTENSIQILKGNEKVLLTQLEEKVIESEEDETSSDSGLDKTLFDKLRSLRRDIASEHSVPPYIIFGDQTLQEMATYYPQTEEQFAQINGVGEQKLKSYGDRFIDEIRDYCETKNIEPIFKYKKPKTKKAKKEKKSDSAEYSYVLYKQGKTIIQIATQRNISDRTVTSHLEEKYLEGADINPDDFIDSSKEEKIRQKFQQYGLDRLSPIKQSLPDNYTWDDIRWTRAKMLKETK